MQKSTSAACKELAAADPVLAAWMDRIGPCKLKARRLSPHESLTRAIVFQQLNGKAAETILNRFLALFPPDGFPSPSAILKTSDETMRSVGLSRSKSAYIKNIAEFSDSGNMPTLDACGRMTDAELIERLTVIKGVGRWTVEMFLIFNLGRRDVLPAHDFGVRKGFQIAYRKRKFPTPEQVERQRKKWSPHNTFAAWYLWRVADTE